MYIELIIGNETYKLRLNTRTSIQLEKQLGFSPLKVLMDIDENKMPKLMDIIIILQSMLQVYHHGYNLDKTMDLYDRYMEDGHTMFDLIPVFIEVLQESGYLPKESEEEEKVETKKGKN